MQVYFKRPKTQNPFLRETQGPGDVVALTWVDLQGCAVPRPSAGSLWGLERWGVGVQSFRGLGFRVWDVGFSMFRV